MNDAIRLALGGALLFVGVGCGPSDEPTNGRAREQLALEPPTIASVSAEFDLDQAARIERPVDCPKAAFGGSSYFVTHSARYDFHTYWRELAVSRFDRQGRPLDRVSIPVGSFDSIPGCAPLIHTGAHFLIVWAHEERVRCTRMLEDGTVLDPGGRLVDFPATDVEGVAWDGTNALVLTSSGSVGLLGDDCAPKAALATLPRTSGAGFERSTLAFDGTQYWVAYTEVMDEAFDQFFVQGVSTTGVVSGARSLVAAAPWLRTTRRPPPLPWILGASGGITVRPGTASLGYVRRDPATTPATSSGTLFFRDLSPAGVLGAERAIPNLSVRGLPAIGFADNGFVVTSNATVNAIEATVVTRIDDAGSVVSVTDVEMPSGEIASLAFDGSNTFIASNGIVEPGSGYFVYDASRARLFDRALQPLSPPELLERMGAHHEHVAVASSSSDSLVVWESYDHLLGSRVSTTGVLLDREPMLVDVVGTYLSYVPGVVSNGSDFLVTWTGKGAKAQRVSAAGTLLGSPFFVPATAPFASDGSGYLLTWFDSQIDPIGALALELRATRASSEGVALDAQPVVLRAVTFAYVPGEGLRTTLALAYDGAAYVVASSVSDPANPHTVTPVQIQRVSSAGTLLGSSETTWPYDVLAMTFGRGQGLVLLEDGARLLAGRVSASGASLDAEPFVVTSTRSVDGRPSVAWDGSNYWVSWKDQRRLVSTGTDSDRAGLDDIYAARVTTEGTVLDGFGIELSHGVREEHQATPGGDYGLAGCALTSAGDRVLAAYTRYDTARENRSFLLHGRFLDSGPNDGGGSGGGGGAGGSAGNGAAGPGPGGAGVGGEAGAAGGSAGADDGGAGGTSTAGQSGEAGSRAGAGGGGGSAGSGATPGASGGSDGGSAGEAGANQEPLSGPSGDDGACGCRTLGAERRDRTMPVLVALLGLTAFRRRRAPRQKSSSSP